MQKKIALVFTGDEFGEGGDFITKTLKQHGAKASFFLTGRFYRNAAFSKMIRQLYKDGHYLGGHSNEHLLYCDWTNRDSLLVTKEQFTTDLLKNYKALQGLGASKATSRFFLPPYEWYNDSIAAWTSQMGLQLINYTPGTLSHADYTTPQDKNYRTSEVIYHSIVQYGQTRPAGLNGFILLMHIGTDPARTDKFYSRLHQLLVWLQARGYSMVTVDELLK